MSTLKNDISVMPQDLFTSSSTQGTVLGSRATTGDGRYFRYVLVGATALVPGQLYQGPASDATNFSPSGGLSVGQAVTTGSVAFTLSNSLTLTANQLAGGTMSVAVTPGQGYTYKVKSNSAVTSATSAAFVLEDPLLTNLSTASRVVFYPNPYNGIVVVGTAPTGPVVGTAIYPVTAAQYGWVQSRGPVSQLVTSSGTPAANQQVGLNLANVTGAVSTVTGTAIFTPVGMMVSTGSTGEYDLVDLFLD